MRSYSKTTLYDPVYEITFTVANTGIESMVQKYLNSILDILLKQKNHQKYYMVSKECIEQQENPNK